MVKGLGVQTVESEGNRGNLDPPPFQPSWTSSSTALVECPRPPPPLSFNPPDLSFGDKPLWLLRATQGQESLH